MSKELYKRGSKSSTKEDLSKGQHQALFSARPYSPSQFHEQNLSTFSVSFFIYFVRPSSWALVQDCEDFGGRALDLDFYTVPVAVCCSVVYCVAVCCSVLQSVAVWCTVLQCVAELQCGVLCCRVLQSVAVCCCVVYCVAVCCSVVYCFAECCRVLQCGALCCSALQSVAVYHQSSGS